MTTTLYSIYINTDLKRWFNWRYWYLFLSLYHNAQFLHVFLQKFFEVYTEGLCLQSTLLLLWAGGTSKLCLHCREFSNAPLDNVKLMQDTTTVYLYNVMIHKYRLVDLWLLLKDYSIIAIWRENSGGRGQMGRVEGEIPEPMKLDHGGKKKERESWAEVSCGSNLQESIFPLPSQCVNIWNRKFSWQFLGKVSLFLVHLYLKDTSLRIPAISWGEFFPYWILLFVLCNFQYTTGPISVAYIITGLLLSLVYLPTSVSSFNLYLVHGYI